MKKMFIINGYPRSGKTLFQEYAEKILMEKFSNTIILKTSVIEPILQIAYRLGWDGKKDEKGRHFLADLKDALDAYKGSTFSFIDDIANNEDVDFIFMDARSNYDIDYAVRNYNAVTIFIERERDYDYNNHADTLVEDYQYDYYINNNKTKEEFYNDINILLYHILNN